MSLHHEYQGAARARQESPTIKKHCPHQKTGWGRPTGPTENLSTQNQNTKQMRECPHFEIGEASSHQTPYLPLR